MSPISHLIPHHISQHLLPLAKHSPHTNHDSTFHYHKKITISTIVLHFFQKKQQQTNKMHRLRQPTVTVFKRYMAIRRPGAAPTATSTLKPKAPTQQHGNPEHAQQPHQQQYYNNQYQHPQQQQYYPPQHQSQYGHVPQQYGYNQQMAPQGYHPQQGNMQQYGYPQPGNMQPYQQAPPPTMGQNVATGIMEGMTFGVGSSLAHRAVDGFLGPRTVHHEFVGGAADAAPVAGDVAAGAGAAAFGEPIYQPEAPLGGDLYSQPPPMFDGSQYGQGDAFGQQGSGDGGLFEGSDDDGSGNEGIADMLGSFFR